MAKEAASGHACAVFSFCRELRELLCLAADATPRHAPPTSYRIGHGS